jgi:galactokinase
MNYSVSDYHKQEYGSEPEVVESAHGVINIMGSYTEATRGLVLLMPVAQEASVSIGHRSDGSMRVYAADHDDRMRTSSSALRFVPDDRYAGIAKGILQRLRQMGVEVTGLNATIHSTIPAESGFAASQAIAVAFARAVARLFERELTPTEVAEVAHYAEHLFLGLPVGLSTYIGAAVGEPGSLVLLDMQELEWDLLEIPDTDHTFAAIVTTAPSALSAAEEIERNVECEACLHTLTGKGTGCSFQEITIKELSEALGSIPESARRWCTHIVQENERVHDIVCALEEDDLSRVGGILTASHQSLSDLYEASFPEVDWIAKHVQETPGVCGARFLGGRTSTSVLICVEHHVDPDLQTVLREFEHIFGFKASLVVLDPVGGAGTNYENSAYKR